MERGILAELLELERRIEAEVATAEAEAARVAAAARRAADGIALESDGSLDEELRSLRASVERECETSLLAIEERADADVELYRRVDESALRELARWVAARIAEGAPAP